MQGNMLSAESDDRARTALAALLSVIDINPANLYKLLPDLPDSFVSKSLIAVAFTNKLPKDYPPTVVSALADRSRQSATLQTLLSSCVLSLDLLAVADLQNIKSAHQHFVQATSSVKKRLKALLAQTFKEVLALDSPDLAGDSLQALLTSLGDMARARKLGGLLGGNLIPESFLVCLAYLVRTPDMQTAVSTALASVWVSQGDKAFDGLLANFNILLDALVKGQVLKHPHHKPRGKPSREAISTKEDEKPLADQSARDKLEEVCFDRSTRLSSGEKNITLKFGYPSPTILPFILKTVSTSLTMLQLDSGALDIELLLNLVKTVKTIQLEEVAFSPELLALRTELQILAVDLSVQLSKHFLGAFQDLYPLVWETYPPRTEPLAAQSAYLTSLITLFPLFPLAYHQTIILEDPNLLHLLPRYLSLPTDSPAEETAHRSLLLTYLLAFTSVPCVRDILPVAQLARVAGTAQTLSSMSRLVLSLPPADREKYSDLTLRLFSLGRGGLAEQIEDSLAFHDTLLRLGVKCPDRTRFGVNDQFLGKRKDWQEYFHTLFQDTRAKTVRAARDLAVEAENHAGSLDEEKLHSKENGGTMVHSAPSGGFGALSGDDNRGAGGSSLAGDTWGHVLKQQPNFLPEKSVLPSPFDRPSREHLTAEREKNNQSIKGVPPTPKKQLFDSEDEDQPEVKPHADTAKNQASNRATSNGHDMRPNRPVRHLEEEEKGAHKHHQPPASPSLSIEFGELEQAPHFTL